jgi:hypothetical protein
MIGGWRRGPACARTGTRSPEVNGMTPTARPHQPRDEHLVLLAAGLAELAVSTAGSVAGKVWGLLRRSDGADLARDAEQDLTARGRLLLDRLATAPPAHLEVLAQHVLAQDVPARRPAPGGDA